MDASHFPPDQPLGSIQFLILYKTAVIALALYCILKAIMGVGEISEIMGAVTALLFIIFAAVCTVRRANRDYSVRLSDGEWNTPESLPFNPDTELKFQTIIQTYKRA